MEKIPSLYRLLLMFGAYCLRSEQVGILLMFGLGLFVWAIAQKKPAWAGVGILILLTKPQVTFLLLFCLGLWALFYFRPVAWWSVIWVGVATVIASIAIPQWWAFNKDGFGAGLSVELAGADDVVAERVNTTLIDFLAYQVGIPPAAQTWIFIIITLIVLVLLVYSWQQTQHLYILINSSLLASLLITPLCPTIRLSPLSLHCHFYHYAIAHSFQTCAMDHYVVAGVRYACSLDTAMVLSGILALAGCVCRILHCLLAKGRQLERPLHSG